jgi:tripartite-type tricarboxylate transporter receptor subunit TctC
MSLRIPASLVAGAMFALSPFMERVHAAAGAPATYPGKTVRVIVGFPPGAGVDITARIFTQKFNEAWGQPVIVENVVGAGGSVGVARVAKAPPDGYTLVFAANGALTIAPSLQSNLPYDPRRDLTPISLAVMVPSVIAVNNDVPAKTFQELIALAKAQPGKLSYSTPGNGTPQHVGGELLKSLAGVDIVHVPYRGAVFTDVIGGRVTIAWQNTAAILPTLRDGRLRGLAVTSLRRSPELPEVPTVSESGFPGFEATSWFAFLAPAGTPGPVIDKVHRETQSVLGRPDLRPRFAQLGAELVGSSPDQLAATIKSDIDKWAKVIKDAGITASE